MKQGKIIRDIELESNDPSHIRVELYYTLGGMNFFTGASEPRGLYLSVAPVEIGDRFVKTTAFSGYKTCVLEMKRFSQKTLDAFSVDEDRVQLLIDHVCRKNKLTLKTEPGQVKQLSETFNV